MDHIFVHTEKMKMQLLHDFKVPETKVSVIPFGINNTLPNSSLTRDGARSQLNLEKDEKVLLFFGRVAEYKGIELAVSALEKLLETDNRFRLVVAGKIEQGHEAHWALVESAIAAKNLGNHVLRNIGYISDEEVEVYFKSADVLILPYKDIFQSGVLFLAYSFGLPVIATDVGSFRDDIVEGETGMVCRPNDAADFADTVLRYFDSALYRNFDETADKIKAYGNKKHSWELVGQITLNVYKNCLRVDAI
jgi:glycosyltransferase involved in cell wall biosynthesis